MIYDARMESHISRIRSYIKIKCTLPIWFLVVVKILKICIFKKLWAMTTQNYGKELFTLDWLVGGVSDE